MQRGMHPNSQANLQKYTATYRPTNPGRKPSKLKKFMKDNNVSSEDVNCIIRNVLFSYSKEQLDELENDETKPVIVRAFIKAFRGSIENGNLKNIEIMFNRAFGAPAQKIEMTGGFEVANMSPETRQERIAELVNKRDVEKNVTPVATETDDAVD